MLKKMLLISAVLSSMAIYSGDCFAQRYINSAEEASKKAKEDLMDRRNHATSQIDWLNNVINVVNMNEPAYKDVAAQNNKAIEESRGR